jgi:hypothetical protein
VHFDQQQCVVLEPLLDDRSALVQLGNIRE